VRLKTTGIIRKVDELGRVVLPVEIRRTLDIAERDELEIFMDNDQIVLKKFEPSCIFCDSAEGLVCYRGKNICQNCVKQISVY
jgi:transcriptional pleiotropic regulator of transition state genes